MCAYVTAESSCRTVTTYEVDPRVGMDYCFACGNVDIRRITIGGCVESIPPFAFYGCTSLRLVDLSGSVKHICVSAFEDCFDVRVVGAEFVKSVGPRAFKNCRLVSPPPNAVYVHKEAFSMNFKS